MTTYAPPTAEPRLGPSPAARPTPARPPTAFGRLRVRVMTGEDAWVIPATLGVIVLAAVLYLVNLTVSGYANVYYSGAAWAASQSWSAWLQGAIDPASFITVDKPPLSTMVMGLSVRLLGLSSFSILLPQALMGVATVALLMATVRRTFGAPASIIAGLVMALTPAAVLIFRYNNPDALLVLLLVAGAWAILRGMASDRLRWVAFAGILVGLAFNAKLLQAYLVLPAFAVTYALCAPGSIRHRIGGLAVALVSVIGASAWWVAVMELLPASSRAFVGGSNGNSALDLVLGYDGLGRILGASAGSGGGGGGNGMQFSGTPGILRLFNTEMGGQAAWFLPASLIGLAAGLVARFRAPRTDLARAGFILWGLWLLTVAATFSFMSGTIHAYYLVQLAPAIAALTGGGLAVLWRAREHVPWAGLLVVVMLLATAATAWMLLERTLDFAPGLSWVVLAVTVIAAVILALPARVDRVRAQVVAVGLALVVLLAGPAAYAAETMVTAQSGGNPAAGPQVSSDGAAGAGGTRGMGQPPSGGGGAQGGGGQGGPGGASLDDATVAFLVANQGDATWLVAVSSASTASQLELDTGRAVMSTGGFTGSDNALSVERLQELVASGELRFITVASGGGPGGSGGPGGGSGGGSSDVSSWVASVCAVVTVDGTTTQVYDCAGAPAG